MKLSSCVLALAFGLAGCSSSSTAPTVAEKKEPPPPPEPVSSQTAVFEAFRSARTWAPDAEVLKAENINLEEVKSQPGKYGAWRILMASKAGKKKREYTYSAIEADSNLHKGIFALAEQPWTPNMQQRSFAIQAVKIDSPAALEEALKNKDVQAVLKKKPDLPVQFALEWTSQTQVPAYRVIWGSSISMSEVSIYIDSQTGVFLKKAR